MEVGYDRFGRRWYFFTKPILQRHRCSYECVIDGRTAIELHLIYIKIHWLRMS